MSQSSKSLSSIDSLPGTAADTFESIYLMLNRLKEGTTTVRDNLKSCNKRIVEIPFVDRLLDPRPHAISWLKKNKLDIPCYLEEFLEKLFNNMATKRRVCHKTRTILLEKEEALLFNLEANVVYKWMEVLERLPSVFY